MDALQAPDLPFSAQTLSPEALRSNIAAYRASAQAAGRVLQSLLLLVSYLSDVQVLGTHSLPQQELNHLTMDVAPQVRMHNTHTLSPQQQFS